MPGPLRFYLCPGCKSTWTGPPGDDRCSWCDRAAVDCSPWGGDGKAWFHARMEDDDGDSGRRKGEAVAEIRYRPERDHRRTLARGIKARGNSSARLRGRP